MIRRQFAVNVLPSMLAFAFTGVYAIVDGWFIGRNMGDNGLAAINLAYPITALIQAVGTGLGMGGAIELGICQGRGEEAGEKRYLGNTLLLLLAACMIVTPVLLLADTTLLRLFGARDQILSYAREYIRVIIYGTSFQILSTGLVPLIRNYNGAVLAMVSMIAGFATNVVLDWLFIQVSGYGMAGAAAATIIGQAVTTLPCVFYLFVKRRLTGFACYRPQAHIMRRIAAVGLSPFGLTLSPNIVIIILNRGALTFGGTAAVSCYAVVSYVVCIIQLLLQGIGDGSQPLISRYFGAGDRKSVASVVKLAYLSAFATAAVCMAGMILLRNVIPGFFGASDIVGLQVSRVLPMFASAFPLGAFLRVTTAYFYAVKRNKLAYLLIYGEPLLLIVLVSVMPLLFGLYGVWTAVPAVQLVLTAAGAVMLKRNAASLA